MPNRTTVTDPERPASAAGPEGIGDIVDAGRSSGYAHLSSSRPAPTTGRLAIAAAAAAAALSRPTLWPRRTGRWQPAPRSARRRTSGRMRVSTIVLEPNGFAPLPSTASHGQASSHGASVLRLASGRGHVLSTSPDGTMRAIRTLSRDGALVLGTTSAHWLVNTGDAPVVAVRVTA